MHAKGVFSVGMFCCTISMFGMEPAKKDSPVDVSKSKGNKENAPAQVIMLPFLDTPCGRASIQFSLPTSPGQQIQGTLPEREFWR